MTDASYNDTVRRPVLMATAIGIRFFELGALGYVAFLSIRWAVSQPDLSAFAVAAVLVGSLAATALALSSTRYLLQQIFESPSEKSFHWVDGRTLSIARHLAGTRA